jgi:hypothetical protein
MVTIGLVMTVASPLAGQLPQPLPQPADFRAAKYRHPRRTKYPAATATINNATKFCMKFCPG